MLTIQNLSYIHPDREMLFSNINLTVNPGEKVALIGNNGTGKSTLFKIISGVLQPSGGTLKVETQPYYIPQIFGQYNHLTVAEALGTGKKLSALHEILNGNVSEENYDVLNEDWTIEERCSEALDFWQLNGLDFTQKMDTVSGGQKTKVFLAGISIHQPGLVLMDEPSNHLDGGGRQLLYHFIRNTKQTLVIVSHDRKLLNLLDKICELNKNGITVYGGNYDFYSEQKKVEANALVQNIQNREKALKKAKEKERETVERQQKADIRAKKNSAKSGLPKIAANTLKNSAERSTAKIAGVHAGKTETIKQELQHLRAALPDADQMKFGFDNFNLRKGKTLFRANSINFCYEKGKYLWNENLTLQIESGERIAVKGANGSGKTTLVRLFSGDLKPHTGTVYRAANQSVYIDQDYSLLNNSLKIYEQARQFNTSALQEHEIKIRLNRFLFSKAVWGKPCSVLSGGERMRLMLCCLSIGNRAPDSIILDEPTNNLDIQNIEILTQAIKDYKGTLLVISHDETFLNQVQIERTIGL